jgi:hypothetical protein
MSSSVIDFHDRPSSVSKACRLSDGSPHEQEPRSKKKLVIGIALLAIVAIIAGAVVAISEDSNNGYNDADDSEKVSEISSNSTEYAVSNAGNPTYLGCYNDVNSRVLSFTPPNYWQDRNNPRYCQDQCAKSGFLYAGVQFGRECRCGNTYADAGKTSESDCSMTCNGDANLKCGGFLKNSIFRSATFDETDGSAEAVPSWGPGRYMGCWRGLGEMKQYVHLDTLLTTPSYCTRECKRLKYPFAGLTKGNLCFCGNKYDNGGKVPEAHCDYGCSGDQTLKCGGGNKASVYSTAGVDPTPGFARDVTGGGALQPVIPRDNNHLLELLRSDEPAVIVLDREYNFMGTTATEIGCTPSHQQQCIKQGKGRFGQESLRRAGHCEGGEPQVSITFDTAGPIPLRVRDNKTLRGVGNRGAIKGKGLRITGSNVIIQNIKIHELNPHIVWGGDALTLTGRDGRPSDLVWIDHVTVERVGRQMLVTGGADGSRRVTGELVAVGCSCMLTFCYFVKFIQLTKLIN